MKDEIKVGDYIRTELGYIGKVQSVNMFNADLYRTDNGTYSKEEIVNHSLNIIDLIKEGDFIKYRLKNLSQTNIGIVRKQIDPRNMKEVITVGFYRINQVEILKIVTKEEFENVGYEV